MELQNFELNSLIQKKSKLGIQGSICWKTYLFPLLQNFASIPKNTQHYFGLDLGDEVTERTFWTHKPSMWQDLFISAKEMADRGQVVPISSKFYGIMACPLRAVPKGENTTKSFKSGKGQLIQHWIMVIPIPADIESTKYIPDFIGNFQQLCKQSFIRSAYKTGVETITQHQGMINQLSEEGSYCNVLDNAAEKEIIFKSFNCLSEFLMDKAIGDVVHLMFGVNREPNTWTDSVRRYAYGN